MGSKVFLRALEPEDYKTTLKWRQDTDLWKTLVGTHQFASTTSEKKWLEDAVNDKNNLRLAICLDTAQNHIGNIYLLDVDHVNRAAYIGILLGDKEHRGKGYGTQAVRLLTEYAFFEKNLERLAARIFADNAASIRAFEKVGFVKEGLLRKAIFKSGMRRDLCVYGLLREEYKRNFFIDSLPVKRMASNVDRSIQSDLIKEDR